MFNVRTVSTQGRKDFDRVHAAVNDWEKIAEKNIELSCSEEEARRWDDYAMLASSITLSEYNALRKKERAMFIAENLTLGGIALIEREVAGVKLNCILANPGNPKSGAGRALMLHIYQKCLDAKIDGIVVNAVPLSVGFYEKLGFEKIETFCPRKGCSMRITAKKMEQVLTKK